MRAFALSLLSFLASACGAGGIPGSGPWAQESLKRTAAAELNCPVESLVTYEAQGRLHSVRGCGKRALYKRETCNRVTRECTYLREGDVTQDTSGSYYGP